MYIVNLNDQMMRKLYLLLFVISSLLFSPTKSIAQGEKIGSWIDFLPYNQGMRILKMQDKLYCATPHSLFYLDLADQSLGTFSKINGLHDTGIQDFAKHPNQDLAIIAYENSNIDIFTNGKLINIPDIKDANIIGDKKIYRISFEDNYAYLSTGFGVVKLNLLKQEISDTWKIAIKTNGSNLEFLNIHDLLINDTAYIAATNLGVVYALKNGGPPEDFNNWKVYKTPKLHTPYRFITAYQQEFFIVEEGSGDNKDIVYHGKENNFKELDVTHKKEIFNIVSSKEKLFIASQNSYTLYNSTLDSIAGFNTWYTNPRDIYIDDNNNIWTADLQKGIVQANEQGQPRKFISINSPKSINAFSISHLGSKVFISAGGHQKTWANAYNRDLVSTFDPNNGSWFNYADVVPFGQFSDVVTTAAPSGEPNHFFAATWGWGLQEFKDEKLINTYNESNSSLQIWPLGQKVVVSGLAYDKKGNLWMVNSGAPKPISVLSPSGEWKAYDIGQNTSGADLSTIMVDQNDQKWVLGRSGGVKVIGKDYPEDPYQVVSLGHNSNSGNIPGSGISSMLTDLDGEVWIGTNDGVAVFYSPSRVQDGNYPAQRINVEINGEPGYLLAGELINDIAIDGGNRKWFATDGSGVFLISPDGKTQIHHFTSDNSPMFSNRVLSIDVNDDGLVTIGTDKGIIGFQSDDSKGGETNSDVHAYPNPVRPNYAGPIAIKGLVNDASVKITDSNGVLVYAARAIGGQAIWNGKTLNGRKVNSGVYLVFITNEDGEETEVSKILFIK